MSSLQRIPELDAVMPPDEHPPRRGLFASHNPLFLLSGVCMLGGCFLINSAVHEDPDRIAPVVWLLAAFNLYEALVIGLGLYLARGGAGGETGPVDQGKAEGAVRDAGLLLVLETLLLGDFTFLYAELFSCLPRAWASGLWWGASGWCWRS